MKIELTEEEAKLILLCVRYAVSRNPTFPEKVSRLLIDLPPRIAQAKADKAIRYCDIPYRGNY